MEYPTKQETINYDLETKEPCIQQNDRVME